MSVFDPADWLRRMLGKPGGIATLNANGRLVQMPTAAEVGAIAEDFKRYPLNLLPCASFLPTGTANLNTNVGSINIHNGKTSSGAFALPTGSFVGTGATVNMLDRFYHNNITNGGTNSALGPEIQGLLAAMGDPNRRYGTEFAIARITYTASTINTWPLQFPTYKYFASGGTTTIGWARLVNGSPIISFTAQDGGDLNDGAWHPVEYFHPSGIAPVPSPGAGKAATIDFALPLVLPGDWRGLPAPTVPIKSIWEYN